MDRPISPCPVCAGCGGWSRFSGMPSRWIPSRIRCLYCRGTGLVIDEPTVPAGG